jgi:hypothetical protein
MCRKLSATWALQCDILGEKNQVDQNIEDNNKNFRRYLRQFALTRESNHVLAAHACDPSYSGGRDQEDLFAQANSL